jgi:hypothetical protein
MIIPLLVGYVIGKTYGKEIKWMILSAIIGIIMGIIGGIELAPIAYPLYATRPLDWMGLPEYRPIAIYFGFPFLKLHQEVVLMTEFSPFIICFFMVVCVLVIMIGQTMGNRKMKSRDLWPNEKD